MGHRSMVVKLLAMHGTEMQARAHARTGPPYYMSALDYAVRFGHLEVDKLLAPIPQPGSLVDGVDPHTVQAHKEYLSIALFDSKGQMSPPCCNAAAIKNVGLVRLLLAAGADPNSHDNDFIPLFNAARHRNLDVVQALLAGGADIHIWNHCAFFSSVAQTPMSPTVTATHHFIMLVFGTPSWNLAQASVKLLLEFGAATVDKPGQRGLTPVDIALREGHPEIVELLEPLVQDPDLKSRIQHGIEECKRRKLDAEILDCLRAERVAAKAAAARAVLSNQVAIRVPPAGS
ncbi:hypothetical protein MSAN_02248300 [Mycena sanguinolenta]|uniref:Ankyrin n=1 Tax=Mycena sanguinolenta TaxID=230812 RepID=A0A8H6XBV0_9AGAR|nr:hypothetical protein MSAN_02248300 [Mycena sanguinolenta]